MIISTFSIYLILIVIPTGELGGRRSKLGSLRMRRRSARVRNYSVKRGSDKPTEGPSKIQVRTKIFIQEISKFY